MRYAVYFVPAADSDLYRLGRSILGYDCYTGENLPSPDLPGVNKNDWRKLTEEPRRYGFHATLKAPFHLLPACTEAQLISAFVSFAGLGHSVIRIEPELRMISGFAAIVPREPSQQLDGLANQCATIFDAFRAPMSAQERARRVASGLGQSQIHNLDRWGYPYLFEDFRFHMTLTGKIPIDRKETVLAALRSMAAWWDAPFEIDRIALVKQDHETANFRVLRQAELATGW